MSKIDRRTVLLGLAATPFISGYGWAAGDFPSRPIKLIVPFGPGSTSDIIARKVVAKAGDILKQPFLVENRPGAGGTIGATAVASADPDGYTLCFGTVASHAIAVTVQKPPYDPIRDFRAVSLLVTTASLIVVNADVPAKTLPEYLDYARKKGASTYVSGGVATTTQLLPELIRVRLNVPLRHVPSSKVGSSFNDLIAGRVDMMCYPAIGLQPYLNTGAIRPLAVAASNRVKSLPDVPTVAEALGSSEYNLDPWFGVFAPANTPDNIVSTLSAALSSAVLSLSDELETIGAQASGWQSDKFEDFVRSEIPRWAEIVRLTGVSEPK